MAKFVPMELLSSLHGKVCGHSDMYFARRGDTNYTGKICHPRTSLPTTKEAANRQKFASVIGKVKTALSNPTEKAQYVTEFKAQRKYKTLYGYVFSTLYKQEG